MRKIKLIWDFKGPDAKQTAIHHTKHLEEYVAIEKLNAFGIDITERNPMLCSAFVIVQEDQMKIFRDALKPHRGEIARRSPSSAM